MGCINRTHGTVWLKLTVPPPGLLYANASVSPNLMFPFPPLSGILFGRKSVTNFSSYNSVLRIIKAFVQSTCLNNRMEILIGGYADQTELRPPKHKKKESKKKEKRSTGGYCFRIPPRKFRVERRKIRWREPTDAQSTSVNNHGDGETGEIWTVILMRGRNILHHVLY